MHNRSLCRAAALLLLAVLCLSLFAGCASLDQTMLIIDGHTVTRGMFNFFVTQASDYYITNYLQEGDVLDPRQEIDGRKIGDLIIDHACRQLANEYAMLRLGAEEGITMTDEHLDAARKELEEFKKEYGNAVLSAYCEEYGMTEEDYVQIYALFNLEDSIQEALFGDKSPNYPGEDILNKYKQEFAEEIYHVQYVMLKDTASGKDNIALAEEVRKMLMEKDAKIEEIVDKYSVTADPNADNDVYLTPDDDATGTVLANLPVGSVSEIVKSNGYYYIFVQLPKVEKDYVDMQVDAYLSDLMIKELEKAVDELEVEETAAYRNYNFEQR